METHLLPSADGSSTRPMAPMSGDMDEYDELSCAICLNLLCEPVRWPSDAADPCPHSFCRACIFRCINSHCGRACPVCRAPATRTWIESPESLPLDDEKQRQIMQHHPAEHTTRQAEHQAELKSLQARESQVLLHTVCSNPLHLRPKKGTVFPLYIRSDNAQTLMMVAAAMATPNKRLGICLEERALEGSIGCFASVVSPLGSARSEEFTLARAVAALLRSKRSGGDDVIRVKLEVGDLFEVCRVTSKFAPPTDGLSSTSTPLLSAAVRARPFATRPVPPALASLSRVFRRSTTPPSPLRLPPIGGNRMGIRRPPLASV